MATPWEAAGFASAEGFIEAFSGTTRGLITYIDRAEHVRFGSRGFAESLGKPLEALIGRQLRELYGEEDYDAFRPFLAQALAGHPVHYERLARAASGDVRWISVMLDPHRDASGAVAGVFACELEVSELKRTHEALERAMQELESHMENSPLAMVEFNADNEIRRWSRQAEAIFGWTAAEAVGQRPPAFPMVHPDAVDQVRDLTKELRDGARRNRMLAHNVTKDGKAIWCEWYNSAFFETDGRLRSILSLVQDVTARVEAEEQLRQAAVEDALTGLPNRKSLAARLEHAIVRVTRSGDRLALIFIDLDRFKKVNDTLGHAAGDEVLRQAAARIRACVREVDSVARLGGDEFVVLLETDVRADTPSIIGERIRNAFEAPFSWKTIEVRCGASVGMSLYPDHARDPEQLLATADEAMYRAKQGA